jgi:hypothetical protein
MRPDAVTANTRFAADEMPALGLKDGLDMEFRVYVLCCGAAFYVGIEHRSEVGERIRKHFEGTATHFTSESAATDVWLVWPAVTRAAEAFVFYAMLEKFGVASLIGGWTQTSSKPSPFASLLAREAHCNLHSQCFVCGSSKHFARDCLAKHLRRTCYYDCKVPGCSGRIYMNSMGQTPTNLGDSAKAASMDAMASTASLPVATVPAKACPSSSGVRMGSGFAATVLPLAHAASPTFSSTPCRMASAQRPKVPPAPSAQTRKRCAAASSALATAEMSFGDLWQTIRKKQRGARREVGSLSDLLRLMETGKATKARKDLKPRIATWATTYRWQEGRDYVADVHEFRSRTGGGKGGFGMCRNAAEDVYRACNAA